MGEMIKKIPVGWWGRKEINKGNVTEQIPIVGNQGVFLLGNSEVV